MILFQKDFAEQGAIADIICQIFPKYSQVAKVAAKVLSNHILLGCC